MIIFGKETAGLPVEFISKYEDRCIRIPMSDNIKLRSLNLANSANIVLFEALRQLGFPELV
jgi:tRNA (cytidine/uridine-2'-O-)-methyltransferase